MNNFDSIKQMGIAEFAKWLDKHANSDGSVWLEWFDKKYCDNCDSVMARCEGSDNDIPFSWCELYRKCRFFPDLDEAPDMKQIIRMWLEKD